MRLATLPWICLLLLLAACDGWPSGPDVYGAGTTAPTRTPRIQTVTPLVVSPTPLILTPDTATATLPAETLTPSALPPSETPTMMVTPATAPLGAFILGCETSIDLLHSMGEVTNAYVRIVNRTGTEAANVCATLRGLDEDRAHPDKTKCFASLPAGYQVTVKLTVDTAYKEATPVQVDLTADEALVTRIGEPACKAIGVLLPGAGELGVPRPISKP